MVITVFSPPIQVLNATIVLTVQSCMENMSIWKCLFVFLLFCCQHANGGSVVKSTSVSSNKQRDFPTITTITLKDSWKSVLKSGQCLDTRQTNVKHRTEWCKSINSIPECLNNKRILEYERRRAGRHRKMRGQTVLSLHAVFNGGVRIWWRGEFWIRIPVGRHV